MAAIERKYQAIALVALLFASSLPLRADRAADVRRQVTDVASALAGSDATGAMAPFDKSFADYDKLSQYFTALTNSFDVVSEIQIGDEEDTDQETTLKANWILQISDKVNTSDVRRAFDVVIHLKPVKGKWKIVSFNPIEMFNPQLLPIHMSNEPAATASSAALQDSVDSLAGNQSSTACKGAVPQTVHRWARVFLPPADVRSPPGKAQCRAAFATLPAGSARCAASLH